MSWFRDNIIEANWNIAIADLGSDLIPVNPRWMRHSYRDRWFADPFILDEDQDTYTILAEEYLKADGRGRICRLTVDKKYCRLVYNQTLLDIDSHLSFPNYILEGDEVYVYPENCSSGRLTIYRLTSSSLEPWAEIPFPAVDPVIFRQPQGGGVCLLSTLPDDSNGKDLHIFTAAELAGPYEEIKTISFADNTARRAGGVFQWKGHLIAPAQICNKRYGEGISLQKVIFAAGKTPDLVEMTRMNARTAIQMTGFHTFNVKGDKVVIDGYKFASEFIHDSYFRIRGFKNK